MKPRPSLAEVERLVDKHKGGCKQPCDGCDLAAEVVALLRLMRFVTAPEGSLMPAERAELQAGDWLGRDRDEAPHEIPGRGLPDKGPDQW